ncbi:MAG TPA: hypothetical protein VK070_09940 [Acidimicrobiia bacterium]|nr:hypothetical protein [Acidimicrobiia bacterium]
MRREPTPTRTKRPRGLLMALCLVGATLIQACDEAAAAPPVLQVIASESEGTYTFDMPETVEEGPTRIDFVNNGEEPHHVQLFKLNEGVTIEEVAEGLRSGPEAVLDLGHFEGGTGLVAPHQESQVDAVVDLTAGTYVVVCFVPGPDGAPHLAHGMLRPLEVTEGTPSAAPPEATHQVDLLDYALVLPDELPGDALLEVTNKASMEPHEMIVAPLPEGVSVDDVLASIEAGEPRPSAAVGGMQAIMPGETQHLQLDLEPGEYVVWCEIPSPDGASHAQKGMIRSVTVQ